MKTAVIVFALLLALPAALAEQGGNAGYGSDQSTTLSLENGAQGSGGSGQDGTQTQTQEQTRLRERFSNFFRNMFGKGDSESQNGSQNAFQESQQGSADEPNGFRRMLCSVGFKSRCQQTG
ncbi:MAG: hypothetical protein ABH829_02565 [archaeon]